MTQEATIRVDAHDELVPALKKLTSKKQPSLRTLVIEIADFNPEESEAGGPIDPKLVAALAAAAPKLESLTLVGHHFFKKLAHPTLKELSLVGFPIVDFGERPVVDLPALQNLRWRFTADTSGSAIPPDLRALWTAAGMPSLESLEVDGEFDTDLTFDVIARSAKAAKRPPVWKQLKHMRIAGLEGDATPYAKELAHIATTAAVTKAPVRSAPEKTAEGPAWLADPRFQGVDWEKVYFPKSAIALVAEAIRTMRGLHRVALVPYGVPTEKLVTISEAIAANTTIEKVHFKLHAPPERGADFADVIAPLEKSSVVDLELDGTKLERAAAAALDRLAEHLGKSKIERIAVASGDELGDEGCAALIDAVGGAKSLKALKLDSVGLSAASAERLAKALAANRSLSSIDIAGNDFGTAIGTVLTALRGHPLDHLRIGGGALTEEVFSAWSRELPHLDVRELDIHESGLEGDAGEKLARALAGSRVTSLRIGENALGKTAQVLAEILASQLVALDLDSTELDPNDAVGVLDALAGSKIEELSLERSELASAKAVGEFLTKTPLRVLRLSLANLGSSAAELAPALPKASTLEELDLSYNDIKAKDARTLLEAARNIPRLRRLSLSGASLDAGGAKAASALLSHPTLEVLELAVCDLRSEGITHLAAAIPNAPRLRRLVLSQNKVNDDAAAALLAAIADNPRFERLELEKTRAGARAQSELRRVRATRPSLAVQITPPE